MISFFFAFSFVFWTVKSLDMVLRLKAPACQREVVSEPISGFGVQKPGIRLRKAEALLLSLGLRKKVQNVHVSVFFLS